MAESFTQAKSLVRAESLDCWALLMRRPAHARSGRGVLDYPNSTAKAVLPVELMKLRYLC
eukprot:4725658-Amphidinium_carterae.1